MFTGAEMAFNIRMPPWLMLKQEEYTLYWTSASETDFLMNGYSFWRSALNMYLCFGDITCTKLGTSQLPVQTAAQPWEQRLISLYATIAALK
jgi:hypothetical protein